MCTENCSTIWLQTQDCAQLNESHIRVSVETASAGSAVLTVTAHVWELPDGDHGFTVLLPTTLENASTKNTATPSTYASIKGTFKVNFVKSLVLLNLI